MSTQALDEALILAAAECASRAPDEWQRLVAAINNCSHERMVECMRAPLDHVHVAQGRAQEAAKVASTLEDCMKRARDIVARRSK